MKKIVLYIFLLLSFTNLLGQSTVDSLLDEIRHTENDTLKAKLYIQVGDLYENAMPDSALFYYKEAEKIIKNLGDNDLLSQILNYQGIIYLDKHDFDKALRLFDSAASLTTDSLRLIYIISNRALIYLDVGLYEKAFKIYSKQFNYFKFNNDTEGISTAASNLGSVYDELKLYDSALYYYFIAYKADSLLKDSAYIAGDYWSIGTAYNSLGDYKKATQYLKKGEKIAINLQDLYLITGISSNLAMAYKNLNRFDSSDFYFKKTIALLKKLDDSVSLAKTYAAYPDLLYKEGRVEKAKVYVDSAINIVKKIEMPIPALVDIYKATSNFYAFIRQYDSAYFHLKKYLTFKDSLNEQDAKNKILIFNSENKIKTAREKLAKVEQKAKLNERRLKIFAIAAFIMLLIIFLFIYLMVKIKKANEELKEAHRKDASHIALYNLMQLEAKLFTEGKLDEFLHKTLKYIIDLPWLKIGKKVVVFIKNTEGKYELMAYLNVSIGEECRIIEKGQCLCGKAIETKTIIDTDGKDNEHQIKAAYDENNGHYILPLIWSDEVLGVVNFILNKGEKLSDIEKKFLDNVALQLASAIHRFKQKEKLEETAQKQDELNQKLFAQFLLADQQKIELEQKNKIIKTQTELLTETLSNLESSVNYAAYLINALLPSKFLLSSIFDEYFLFFKPRNVIGGDFYYAKKISSNIYFSLGDATGHGVPGAVLASLTITYIKEMVERAEIYSPARLLNQLRTKIKTLFSGSISQGVRDSGVEMVFCIFDTKNNTLTFAGANMNVYIVRDRKLTTYKGTRAPVGSYIIDRDFTEQKIQLQKNDIIYLSSDGFPDQFNEKGQKYSRKRFLSLLEQISELPLDEQYKKLKNIFDEWRGPVEQIDDVTVFGLKWKL